MAAFDDGAVSFDQGIAFNEGTNVSITAGTAISGSASLVPTSVNTGSSVTAVSSISSSVAVLPTSVTSDAVVTSVEAISTSVALSPALVSTGVSVTAVESIAVSTALAPTAITSDVSITGVPTSIATSVSLAPTAVDSAVDISSPSTVATSTAVPIASASAETIIVATESVSAATAVVPTFSSDVAITATTAISTSVALVPTTVLAEQNVDITVSVIATSAAAALAPSNIFSDAAVSASLAVALAISDVPAVTSETVITGVTSASATSTALVPSSVDAAINIWLTAVTFSNSQINLDWDEPLTGVTGYDIERDGVIIVTNHPVSSYSDTGLTNGIQYCYRVRALFGSAYQSLILSDAPTVYWPLTDSAEPLTDLSGNGYAGDANTTVTFSQAALLTQPGDASCGFVNGGGAVAGSEIATLTNPSAGGGMSIEAWFDSNASNISGGIVISIGDGGNGFAIEYNSELETTGALNYLSHALVRSNVATITDNAVHHVVATRTAGGAVLVYLDGVSVGSVGSPSMNALQSTDRLLVGRDRTVPRGLRGFDGRISHAAFYNSVLSAARVLAHYNQGKV